MNLRNAASTFGAALAVAIAAGCTTEPMAPLTTAAFVGSERCGACHTEQYKTWKTTLHANMVRTRDAGILKDVVANWASDGKNPGPTKVNLTGTGAKLDDVTHVVGSHWKQRF